MILEVGRNTQYRLAAVKGHTYELTRTHTLPKPVCCSLKCVSLPQVLRGSVVICLILPCVCVCVCVCVCLPPRPPVALRMFSDDWTGGLRELCVCVCVASGSAVLSLQNTLKTKGTDDEEWPTTVCTACFCRLCVPPSVVPCPNLWFAAMSELVGMDESVCSCVCIWYSCDIS